MSMMIMIRDKKNAKETKTNKKQQHLKKRFATVLRTFKRYDPMKLLIFTHKIH